MNGIASGVSRQGAGFAPALWRRLCGLAIVAGGTAIFVSGWIP